MNRDPVPPKSAWETCPACGGSGLALNMAGEPDACRYCHGDTVIRTRDAKGRFVPNPEPKP